MIKIEVNASERVYIETRCKNEKVLSNDIGNVIKALYSIFLEMGLSKDDALIDLDYIYATTLSIIKGNDGDLFDCN